MDILSFPIKYNFTHCVTPRTIDLIVVHIMDGTLLGTDAWFANLVSRVSAHYGIGKLGQVHQYVLEKDIAWHAGIPYPYVWAKQDKNRHIGTNPNAYSIGIEHEGRSGENFTAEQWRVSSSLIASICKRYSIPIDREHIVRHSEIYAGHDCPGSQVDVDKLVAYIKEII